MSEREREREREREGGGEEGEKKTWERKAEIQNTEGRATFILGNKIWLLDLISC